MKRILHLTIACGLFHFALQSPIAAESVGAKPTTRVAIDISHTPVFSILTDQGVSFVNDQADDHQPLRLNRSSVLTSGRPLELQCNDTILLTLTNQGKEAPPLLSNSLSINFRARDLTPPGSSYPPAQPVGATTPLRSISTTSTVTPKNVESITSLVTFLGMDAAKARAWIENRLWENTEGLRFQGSVPGGTTFLDIWHSNEQSQTSQQPTAGADSHTIAQNVKLTIKVVVLWGPRE